jgi:hypothetical protein
MWDPYTALKTPSPPFSPSMALTEPIVEVPASPSHSAIALRTENLVGPPARPPFASSEPYQPDVMRMKNLGVDEARTPAEGEPAVVTKAYSLDIRKLNIKFAVVCLALFLEGWNLGATGPLIPAIQKYYNVGLSLAQKDLLPLNAGQVNYILVSMIFLVQCIVRHTSQEGVALICG